MTISHKLKTTNIKAYIFSIFATVIGLSLNFLLARVLQAEKYGSLQFIVSLFSTISSILIFGFTSFIVREVGTSNNPKTIMSNCYSLYIALSIFLFPIIFYVLFNYIGQTNGDCFNCVLIILTAFLMGIDSLFTSYFLGKGKYHFSIVFETILPKGIILLFSIISFALNKVSIIYNNYLLIYFSIYLIISLLALIKLFRGFNISFKKEDIITISFFYGTTITYSLTSNMVKVLQGAVYNNNVALAIISVSSSIIALVNVFTNVLNNITKPIYAFHYKRNDIDSLIKTYRFATRTNSYIAMPLFLFFITQGFHFLSFFGDSYLEYPLIIVILSISSMVSCITGPNGTMLSMAGKEKYELFNGVTHFSVFIVSAFLFSFNPVYGLCFSFLFSEITVNILKFVEVWFFYKRPPLDIKTILSLSIILVVDFGCIFFLRYIDKTIVWFSVGLIVGIAVVVLNFILSFYGRKDFKMLLKSNLLEEQNNGNRL